MNIAIIPARGGSKRIPHKNIKDFCGKPIITYSIEAALKTNCFDRVIVSTDDNEIARISENFGAEVPFFRPENLSDDHTGTIEVIQHTISELNISGDANICCLYATAPFITSDRLLDGLKTLEKNKANYVFSATEFSFPIQRAFHFNEENKISMFQPEHFKTRSQDLTKAFHDAGQFYWGKCFAFKSGKAIFSNESQAIIFPRTHVQDIDTHDDWDFAELLFKLIHSGN